MKTFQRPDSRTQGVRWVVFLLCSILVLSVAGCGNDDEDGAIVASGFIEGEEVVVAPEMSGRIVEMLIDRGDPVEVGQPLVRLSDTVLRSQRMEAEAGLAAAQANLDRVLAGARAEEISAARAALDQAQADLQGATQGVIDARDVISNPLSLDAEIAAARTEVALAEQNVEMAEAELGEMEVLHGHYSQEGGDAKRTWDLQLQATRSALDQAQAELDGAQAYLSALLAMRANPLTQQAQLHAAQMEQLLAQAQVMAAEAEVNELEAGPTAEEIAVAQAQVHQAQAALDLIDAQIDMLTLTAPMDGMVTSRSSQRGETATAGAPILTIANLDEVTLVIYVPETRVGQVKIGQEVEVQVDSFPDEVFIGNLGYIAGEAEFTPRNVQTQEERVNLVFAVKVRIPNPDHALKPGMPADATIRVE